VHRIHVINCRASVKSFVNQYQKCMRYVIMVTTCFPCHLPILGTALFQLMGGIMDVILRGAFSCLSISLRLS